MAQSNEQGDDELREQISNLMADLMVESRMIKLADKPSMIEQGRDYINAHNKRLNVIMQLILADCKQHELEARKEQIMQDWNSLDNFCDHHDESEELAWRDSRLKELEQS